MLRRRVGLNAGQARPQTRARCNVDDAAKIGGPHWHTRGLRQPERGIDVRREDDAPVVLINVLDRPPNLTAHADSVLRENVETTISGDRFADKIVGVGAPAEIHLMALESGRFFLGGPCDWRVTWRVC